MVFRVQSNANEIAREIDNIAATFEGNTVELLNGIAFEIDAKLKNRDEKITPIDTGFARNSWHFEIARISHLQVENYNTAPYIRRLEHGHSQQAPHGMTIRIIEQIDGIIKTVAEQIDFV